MAIFKSITKEMFFDRPGVMSAVEKGVRQSLSKVGAFVRTRMRSLTGRRSSKPAEPGQPPKRHAGDLHDRIIFGYDADDEAVYVGPALFTNGDVPGLLEQGGTARRTRRRFVTRGGLVQKETEDYTAHYRGNPFALPALQAEVEAGNVPRSFENSIHA